MWYHIKLETHFHTSMKHKKCYKFTQKVCHWIDVEAHIIQSTKCNVYYEIYFYHPLSHARPRKTNIARQKWSGSSNVTSSHIWGVKLIWEAGSIVWLVLNRWGLWSFWFFAHESNVDVDRYVPHTHILHPHCNCCTCTALSFIHMPFHINAGCKKATDIRGRSQNLHHYYPGMGLRLGVFGFSRYQNNRGSSGAYATCIVDAVWAWRLNTSKMPHFTQRSRMHWQKPEDHQFEPRPMADNTITWGGIGGLGYPLYICERGLHAFLILISV